MYHAVNTVSMGSGMTFYEGREDASDTIVLGTEMENNINDQENSKMTLIMFKIPGVPKKCSDV